MRQRRNTGKMLWLSLLITLSIATTGIIGQTDEPTEEIVETEEVMPEVTLEPATLRNPLNASAGADPWIVYHEGYYYLSTTSGASAFFMRKSPTLAGLKNALPQLIHTASLQTEADRCCNMWAPEFHLLDGPNGPRWYYYYSAGTSGTLDNQRTHVLESAGTDPMGPYTYKARIFDPENDGWAIDGTVLKVEDDLYFVFSSWVDEYQIIFIAPMSDPWTISGTRVELIRSEYDWERSGLNVTEGPVALYHEDKTYLIYSASFCATPDYALGMLTYLGGDPMDPASWEKHPQPVFQRSDENGVYGPAHNGFFKSPDGTEDWIVYHANDSETDGCDQGRTTRVQKFTWNEDGTPNFGVPVSTDTIIDAPSGDEGIDLYPDLPERDSVRFASVGIEGAYLRHVGASGARLDFTVNPIEDSQFVIVPGLADPEAVSFEAVNNPGFYLAEQSNIILLAPHGGSEEAASMTWWLRPGLSDPESISIESYSQPGKFIGRRFGILALVAEDEMANDQLRAEATFRQEDSQ
jgi:GH43 family beta-xylosidase